MSLNLLIFILLSQSCFYGPKGLTLTQLEQGHKIGFVKNKENIISIDSIKFKEQWEKILPLPDVKLDKIEIRRGFTKGEREEEFYMLMAYDYESKLKTARWLIKKDGSFYFYKSPVDESNLNHPFFRTYFTCYGDSGDCNPHVFIIDNRYYWTSTEKFYCDPNSPCKSSSIFFPDE
ncbi:hypothetical protein OGH69_13495 [Flavobacterium sp. MFBS3-15]|uniref:hypothetical protein n=1 Tax=Flavobacterium sp. MFBS3-15 TaxID=2989816 RepID=UPI0022355449|nr:hypothetical protein [Flavobacterium sp. MFBS3-15]MCW4469987.1 hypothetical protein [Flavobacterium sp. MFBS3-15]